MRRILIIVATVALTTSALRAEDAPSSNSPGSSERGPNFPASQTGPAFPAIQSDQQPNPSFGAQVPTPQSRWTPQRANQILGAATLASVKIDPARSDKRSRNPILVA